VKKEERRLQILELLRANKKKYEIAKELGVHPNTITKDIKWLKANVTYDFTLTKNKIIGLLEERIINMSNRDLISFLRLLLPTKIEASGETTTNIIMRSWQPDAERNKS